MGAGLGGVGCVGGGLGAPVVGGLWGGECGGRGVEGFVWVFIDVCFAGGCGVDFTEEAPRVWLRAVIAVGGGVEWLAVRGAL